jgi:CHAD domain-containing protein
VPARNEEIELKLLVSPEFELPDLEVPESGVAKATELDPLDLTATYFDTSDLRLLRNGITLRYRTGEEPGPKWTVKLPNGRDDTRRTELDFVADGTIPTNGPSDLLWGVLGGRRLEPIVEMKTRRRRWSLVAEQGNELATLTDDRVSVLNGNNIADTFREIEIEAAAADRKQLQRIADVITDAGGHNDQRSKFSRAVDAVYGEDAAGTPPRKPSPGDPATDAVRPMLAAALARLLANDPHARLGDVEGVHQLRVGARRLRSVFRTFAPLLVQEKVAPIVDDLRWLGQMLGAVRDLDVVTATLHTEPVDEKAVRPLFATLAGRRATAYAELSKALSSDRYLGLIEGVGALIEDEGLTMESPGPCREVLPELVEKSWGKLRSAAKKLERESPAEEFHRVRILAKRARYTAESVEEFTKSKARKRLSTLASESEAVQNTLGEQQDAFFARDLLQEIATEHPTAGSFNLWLGRLIERQEQRAKQRAEEFFAGRRKLEEKRGG